MLGALICTKFIVTLSDQRLMPHCTLDHFGDEYQQTSLQQLTMAHSVAQNGSDIFLFSSLSFLLLSLSFFSSILPSFFSFFPFISILPLPLTSPFFFILPSLFPLPSSFLSSPVPSFRAFLSSHFFLPWKMCNCTRHAAGFAEDWQCLDFLLTLQPRTQNTVISIFCICRCAC